MTKFDFKSWILNCSAKFKENFKCSESLAEKGGLRWEVKLF